jgi:hypothetical protein
MVRGFDLQWDALDFFNAVAGGEITITGAIVLTPHEKAVVAPRRRSAGASDPSEADRQWWAENSPTRNSGYEVISPADRGVVRSVIARDVADRIANTRIGGHHA